MIFIKFRIFLQADMIFFDQLIVYAVKFGNCFAEFMIPIALLKVAWWLNLANMEMIFHCFGCLLLHVFALYLLTRISLTTIDSQTFRTEKRSLVTRPINHKSTINIIMDP